jgi:hypothetical protein
MDDRTFKLAVGGGAAALVGVIVLLRFCGSLSVAPLPPAPAVASTQSARDILVASSETAAAWQAFVEKDAKAAGIAAPSAAELGRVLPYAVDETRRSIAPGDAPIEVAKLRLHAEVARADGDADLVLVIENRGASDLAYHVVTRPSMAPTLCHSRQVLFYDANVVEAHSEVRRSECVYRDGDTLQIDRVETIELSRLSSYYVSRLPAAMLTLDTRLTVGHKPLGTAVPCNVMMSQVIKSKLESGVITWRDLADFYARHRCDTYPFPEQYKAFTSDNQRELPAVSESR